MANQQYRFTVNADTEGAEQKLQEISKLMDNIDRINSKGKNNYFTTSQKDMDKSMRTLSELTSKYKEVDKLLGRISQKKQNQADNQIVPSGASKNEIKRIEAVKKARQQEADNAKAQQKELQKEFDKTNKKHRNTASFKQTYSKNFESRRDPNDEYNLPRGSQNWESARNTIEEIFNRRNEKSKENQQTGDKIGEANKLYRRSESQFRRAQSSGYMSYQQYSNFRSDYAKSQNEYRDLHNKNVDKATNLGQEKSRLVENIQGIEKNPNTTQHQRDRKLQMQNRVKEITNEIERLRKLNGTLSEVSQSMQDFNRDLEGIEVKPERGTTRGMMYERAPAIGLSLGGSVGAAFGGLYSKGSSVKSGMRDDLISIGQRTGEGDMRHNIRNEAMDMGLQDNLGYTGQEMLQFQDSYLSKMGQTNDEDVRTAMQSQAEFGRVTGTSPDQTKEFFDSVFGTHAVKGNQVSELQDAFVGGIKESGMEGRQNEQLEALQGVFDQLKQGRDVSNEEVMSRVGLQSILAESGNPALQGEEGGQLMQNMGEGFRGAVDDKQTRLLFGQGTEYQGLGEQFDLRKQFEEGASAENFRTLSSIADYMGNNDKASNEVFARIARSNLGVDVKADQAEDIMDLYREGNLDEDNLRKTMEKLQEEGSNESNDLLEQYQNSKPALDNQSEATTEKQAAHLNDFGDIVKKANSAISGFPSPVYGAIAALGAFSAALASTGAMFGTGGAVRRGAAHKYRSRGKQDRKGNQKGPPGPGLGGSFFGLGGGSDKGSRRGKIRQKASNFKKTTQRAVSNTLRPGQIPDITDDSTRHTAPTRARGGGKIGSLLASGSALFSMVTGSRKGRHSKGNRYTNGVSSNRSRVTDQSHNISNTVNKGNVTTDRRSNAQRNNISNVTNERNTVRSNSSSKGKGGLLSKIGKGIGKTGKSLIGKIGLPIAAIQGASQIASAEEGHKAEAAGDAIGGLGGAAAGGAAGASIGSVVPGVGTAIGGLAGSVIGGFSGSSVGSSVGNWFSGLFGDDDKTDVPNDVDKDVPEQETKQAEDHSERAHQQEKKEVANQRDRAQNKKEDNISEEKTNLTLYEKLLRRSEQILMKARAQNGIIGQPDSASGATDGLEGNAGNVSGSGNAGKIWNFLSDKGLNKNAIAGVMGNLKQESGFDPTETNSSSGATGIAQWLGSRKAGLKRFAKDKGTSADDLDTQLQYLWKEMDSGDQGLSVNKLNNMSASEAAKYFSDNFERPGAREAQVGKRQDYAENIYSKFGSKAQTQRTLSSNSSSGSSSGGGTHKIKSDVNVNVVGDESISEKLKDNRDMQKVGEDINNSVLNSLNYHSKETRRG